MKVYYAYIMSNFQRTVFYIGITNNIETRVRQHKNNEGSLFTAKHKCHHLLFYEEFPEANQAIAREKQLKNWHRDWKINLIRKENPEMLDLSASWI